jgi:hypothetical protein
MVSKRAPTWDKGRETVVETHADKTRGFMNYERLSLPYRDAKERVGDYDEVLMKLDNREREQLLNTQVCVTSHHVPCYFSFPLHAGLTLFAALTGN